MSGHSGGLADILSIVVVLAVEYWIIASLVVGLIMFLVGSAINDNAQTNAGAVTSGIIGVFGQVLFGFGFLASIIWLVKFIWIHA